MKQKTSPGDRVRHADPSPARSLPAARGTELRSIFRRRVDALVERLAEQASDESLAAALEAPSDFGGLARLLSDSAALGVSLETVDPLAEAVARGAEIKQELLREAGGGWSSPRVAELLGITRQAVDKRRRAGKLLALQTGQGDHVYPVCQFADGEVLPGLDRFLAAFAAGGPWVHLSVLLAAAEEIGGISPLDALRRGDVEAAVLVASTHGEQGGPAEHARDAAASPSSVVPPDAGTQERQTGQQRVVRRGDVDAAVLGASTHDEPGEPVEHTRDAAASRSSLAPPDTSTQERRTIQQQVARLTARIDHLTADFRKKKDHHARRSLMLLVGKRRRLLDRLHRIDPEAHRALTSELSLRS